MKAHSVLRALVLTLVSFVFMTASVSKAYDRETEIYFDSPGFLLELETAFLAAFARQTVVTIETDVYPGTATLFVTRETDGSLASIAYAGHDGAVTSYTLNQLKKGFQVLKKHEGRDAVFLKLDSAFSAQKGGYAVLRVLRNGISGSHQNFRVFVKVAPAVEISSDPDSSDPDSDQNSFRGRFNYVFMKKNTVLGFAVGIDEIRPALR